MKPGDIVEYIHWNEDSLLQPGVKFGIILKEPNEVGKLRILFGHKKMWIWSGDIKVIKHAVR